MTTDRATPESDNLLNSLPGVIGEDGQGWERMSNTLHKLERERDAALAKLAQFERLAERFSRRDACLIPVDSRESRRPFAIVADEIACVLSGATVPAPGQDWETLNPHEKV